MIFNDYNKIILTIILGIFGGIIGGTFGIGTSIALPGFILLGIIKDTKTAIGTALISNPLSWPAAYKYYKNGKSVLTLGLIFSFFYIIFAYVGSYINESLTNKELHLCTSIIYFLFSVFFLYISQKDKN